MPNIICITSDAKTQEYLKPLNEVGNLQVILKQNLSNEEFVSLTKNSDILIVGPSGVTKLSSDILKQLPNLKFISLFTIGYDWVDTDYAKSITLPISTTKGGTSESVAEHTWGMILGLSKRINEFDREARFNGAFNFSLFKGKEIYGKTIGIVGLGDIGKKVARIALGFEMKVIGTNKSGNPVENVELVDLNRLLRESDVITLCLPVNSETKDLLGKEEIEQMKNGVIVVNCAREEIVNKEAIIDGIRSGKVFGYGVETKIMKALEKNDPYYSYPNIIVTPHNAFNTYEADIRTHEIIIENIKAFLEKKSVRLIYYEF